MLVPYNLAEVLAEVLRHSAVKKTQTEDFRRHKHNRDLCPRAQRQLTHILENFVKYYAVAYDVQGPGDQGADVVLQLRSAGGTDTKQARTTVLQIKSYDDLDDKDYLTILRAQYQQALSHYGQNLEHYYVLLCTDEFAHLQKIRSVNQAFSTLANATIIPPAYSLAFLRFSAARIGLIVQDLLRDEDIVVTRARKLISGLTPPQAAILLLLAYHASVDPKTAITMEMILTSPFVQDVYGKFPDYDGDSYAILEERIYYEHNPEQFDPTCYSRGEHPFKAKLTDRGRPFATRVADDLDGLDDVSVEMPASSNTIAIDMSEHRPIQCLILDTMVRYSYSESELLHFVYGVLQIAEEYGIDIAPDDQL